MKLVRSQADVVLHAFEVLLLLKLTLDRSLLQLECGFVGLQTLLVPQVFGFELAQIDSL